MFESAMIDLIRLTKRHGATACSVKRDMEKLGYTKQEISRAAFLLQSSEGGSQKEKDEK